MLNTFGKQVAALERTGAFRSEDDLKNEAAEQTKDLVENIKNLRTGLNTIEELKERLAGKGEKIPEIVVENRKK